MNQYTKGSAWLSTSTKDCLAWAYSTRFYEPDMINHECVVNFEEQGLESVFCKKQKDMPKCEAVRANSGAARTYTSTTLVWSPVNVGIPSERPRKYTQLLLGGVIYPLHMPSASSADGDGKRRALLFKELFFKNCQLDASVYMCAPPELIKKHVWAIGIKAGVIVTDGDVQAPADDGDTGEQNTAGGSTDTMGPIVDRNLPGEITGAATNVATLSDSIFLHTAYQSRLAQYMKLLPADSANRPNVAMVNLEQNVYRSSSAVSKMAPTLLRGSILHELATDKMVVPLQHWLIMGWPVPGLVPNRFSGFFPFPDLLESLTPCQSRTLTGNGMHVAAIGLWTLYGLATTGKEYRDVE